MRSGSTNRRHRFPRLYAITLSHNRTLFDRKRWQLSRGGERCQGRQRLAIMCAEAVPWRCHRSLIADALTARGVQVEHIASATRRDRHTLTAWARVERQRITYPPESLPLDFEPNE
jgi:hypothetical protein